MHSKCLLTLPNFLAVPDTYTLNQSPDYQINIPSSHSHLFLQSVFLACPKHRPSDLYQTTLSYIYPFLYVSNLFLCSSLLVFLQKKTLMELSNNVTY